MDSFCLWPSLPMESLFSQTDLVLQVSHCLREWKLIPGWESHKQVRSKALAGTPTAPRKQLLTKMKKGSNFRKTDWLTAKPGCGGLECSHRLSSGKRAFIWQPRENTGKVGLAREVHLWGVGKAWYFGVWKHQRSGLVRCFSSAETLSTHRGNKAQGVPT